MSDSLTIERVESPSDLDSIFDIRRQVFCVEQGFGEWTVNDNEDEQSINLVAKVEGEEVACGRVRQVEDFAKIERVSVLPTHRRQGYGSQIIAALVVCAGELNVMCCKLTGQVKLQAFYQRNGFTPEAGSFLIDNTEHYWFVRQI